MSESLQEMLLSSRDTGFGLGSPGCGPTCSSSRDWPATARRVTVARVLGEVAEQGDAAVAKYTEAVRPRGALARRVPRVGPGPCQGAQLRSIAACWPRFARRSPTSRHISSGSSSAAARSSLARRGDSIHADSTGGRVRARRGGAITFDSDHDRRAGPGRGRQGDRGGLAAAVPEHPPGDSRGLP